MAQRKRRGPGRPPKARGPGRPKGSRNKPRRGPGRPSKALAEFDREHQIGRDRAERSISEQKQIGQLQLGITELAERCEAEWANTNENLGGIVRRQRSFENNVLAMQADVENPTTRLLAQRLILLENREKVGREAHERITQLQHEVRTLRHDLNELLADRRNARNYDAVAALAAEPEPEGDGESEQGTFLQEDTQSNGR